MYCTGKPAHLSSCTTQLSTKAFSQSTFHLHDSLVGYILVAGLLLALEPSLILLVGGYNHDHTTRRVAREWARLALLRIGEYVGLQTKRKYLNTKWSREMPTQPIWLGPAGSFVN